MLTKNDCIILGCLEDWLLQFFRAISYWVMRFLIGLCWVLSTCFWGLRNQNLSLDSSRFGVLSITSTYWMASSWFLSKSWNNGDQYIDFMYLLFYDPKFDKLASFIWCMRMSSKNDDGNYVFHFWVIAKAGQLLRSSSSSSVKTGRIMPVTFSV